jgi:5-methyltetrahydrofolate--homocysteine methyltransferase
LIDLKELVKTGDDKGTEAMVIKLLEEGKAAEVILNEALIPALDEVGELYQKGEYFLPEMLIASRAAQRGIDILRPKLKEKGIKATGKAVMGTVEGDMHDLGKNLVVMTLEGAGFEVIDVGADASPDKFVKAIREHKPQVVGLSALLSTTMPSMKETIDTIKKAGLRADVKIIVGGAPVTQKFADEIGADFYGTDAVAGKDFARSVVASG